MSLLEKYTGLLKPSAREVGTLFGQTPTNTDDMDFTVSRASEASEINKDGLIATVANNVPRLNYGDGDCPSLLLERARTNLFLNSDVGATQTITVSNATEYTIYFLSGTGTIDLSGAFTATINVSDYTYNNSLTFTTTSTSLVCTVNGEANQVQVEAGSYPTSYIETTAATVNRAADLVNGATYSGDSESGVFMVDASIFDISENVGLNISINSGDYVNSLQMSYYANTISMFARINNVLIVNEGLGYADLDTPNKIAIRWAVNDYSLWINGAKVKEDLTAATYGSGVLTNISFNRGDSGSPFYGNCQQLQTLAYLTDAEMASLTT